MNKSVLITGCSRGLGNALAKVYLKNGSFVFPLIRNAESTKEWIDNYGNRCCPILADISNDVCEEKIQETICQNGNKLDLLINNAGVPGIESTLQKSSSSEILNLFNIHCVGVLRVSKACLGFLKKSSDPKIINITSRLGSLTKVDNREFAEGEFSYSYRIAKAAQNMLSLCMAQELEINKIKVYSIHPGRIKTNSAAANATLDPTDAAKRIFDWIENKNTFKSGTFYEPGIGKLPW